MEPPLINEEQRGQKAFPRAVQIVVEEKPASRMRSLHFLITECSL